MSEIFVPDPADADRPVDYVANPLRVQLPVSSGDKRPYARLDLIALANSIVDRETALTRLHNMVVAGQFDRVNLERLTSRVERLEAKLSQILTAFSNVVDTLPEDDEDE